MVINKKIDVKFNYFVCDPLAQQDDEYITKLFYGTLPLLAERNEL